jgi:hypothetical protein
MGGHHDLSEPNACACGGGGVLGAVLVNQVGVRMDDGSRRGLEISRSPAVGSQVTLDGSSIHRRGAADPSGIAGLSSAINQAS